MRGGFLQINKIAARPSFAGLSLAFETPRDTNKRLSCDEMPRVVICYVADLMASVLGNMVHENVLLYRSNVDAR